MPSIAEKKTRFCPTPLPHTSLTWFSTQYQSSPFHGRFQIGFRKKNGTAILPLFTGTLDAVNSFLDGMYVSGDMDYYITANAVSGVRRHSGSLFSLHNIVVDIDAHSSDILPTTSDFDTLLRRLDWDIFSDDDLPHPTSIVQTGRGIQLWWAIIPMSGKCLCWYKEIQNTILDAVEYVLSEYPELSLFSVDRAASGNPVGYFRLPGTVNTRAQEIVTVEHQRATQYSTHDLIRWAKEWQEEHPPEPPIAPSKDFSGKYLPSDICILRHFNTTAFFRVRQLIQLRILRDNEVGAETRNNLCLIVYNAMLPVLGAEKAWETLLKFNEGFKKPMSEWELHQTVDTSRKRGGYRYKNETIIRFLNITREEQAVIGLYPSSGPYTPVSRMSGHPGRRARSRTIKQDRNTKIRNLAANGMSKSRIAVELGISRNTVAAVMKETG